VERAVKRGELARGACEVCGEKRRVHAHHESYAEEDRLKVRWLCPVHHGHAHRIDKERAA
jgi:hypothetical protein